MLYRNENAEDKSVLMAYYKRKYVVSLPKSPAMSFNELLGTKYNFLYIHLYYKLFVLL